jgi:serine/threonine protein kinase
MNYKILNEIGNGVYGKTYKIEYNNKLYALKKQKILKKNIKLLQEVKFYNWIKKLRKSDKVFFMELYKYNIVDNCHLEIDRTIINKDLKKLDKSNHCIEFILDLKDGNLTELNLNNQQKISLLIQVIYTIYLMRKSGWQHKDIHPANICYKKVSSTTKVPIYLDRKYNIDTHGYIFSLIDYGFCTKDTKGFKYNFDLWCLIEDVCLNGYYNYKELNKNNLKQSKNFYKDLTKLVYKTDTSLYEKIKIMLLNAMPDSKNMFKKLEKNKKLDDFVYHFCQYVKLYDIDLYYKELGIKPIDNYYESFIIEFIKAYYDDLVYIIKYFIKLI